MAKQIASSCIEFLADATELSDSETPSWMRPAPIKKIEKQVSPRKWEEVLEMFVDLSQCLSQEERLKQHVTKLEVMREGLYQIKDILLERDISYKEARRQDCLVQRKLTKSLGHSSKCLFTLLLYYLYGSVRDIEVEVCESVHVNDDKFSLNVGKILTCCDEEMLWSGVKQLSRALGVYKFVWETTGMKGKLELQGHLWCLGAEVKEPPLSCTELDLNLPPCSASSSARIRPLAQLSSNSLLKTNLELSISCLSSSWDKYC
ncbi:hypothetical protein J5N97_004820 [Dioscorea zingiberensis]|uniref:Uncharacterized protein n=1 Tax=Dioscorea zingiberensis TaxID=325984 RepID=A0A9D5HRT1_9LILI|nr:hypothetical protein J5N97_004820 [Dioscorea zingiberensis]